jgi:ribosomal protein S18 acetylase RimI-like enzyme
VAIEQGTRRLAGFYTLSAAEVSVGELPEETARRLPPYPIIPAALIGRLAVDLRFRGIRLGEALLLDAADRVLDAGPAAFALLVDAKDDAAMSFYVRYGFRRPRTRPMMLFLPVASLEARRRKDTTR